MDFSKTQRIVLFIDLQPLLALQTANPNPYITTILAAAKRFLTFPALSASLFAFKLFFSSLSPIRSSSAVHRLLSTPSSNSLSFNHPSQTLDCLSTTLNSLSLEPQIFTELSNSSPLAAHVSSALFQLVHDYAWESETELGNDNDFPCIRSNLVILFSPICKSLSCLSEFINGELNSEGLDQLIVKFHGLFHVVKDAFISKDIHFSWINVNYDLEAEENEYQVRLRFLEKGIRSLNWGVCSTDAIVLGSALIPFELIYPKIGVLLNFDEFTRKKKRMHLSLEISDVSGKPLECKCCDLEMLNLKTVPSIKSDDILNGLEFQDSQGKEFDQGEKFMSCFGEGITKLNVKAVWKNHEKKKLESVSSNCILVREFSGESKKSKKECSEEFFADKVMEILSNEPGQIRQVNTAPIWQILLSFLNREDYCAEVVVSNEFGKTAIGILKPFTAHWALLSVIDNGFVQFRETSSSNITMKATDLLDSCHDNTNTEGFICSQTDTSTSGYGEPSLGDGKRRKSRKHQNLELTWNSFSKSALECFDFDLAEVYFARMLKNSKKLKFFRCWMKQIVKHSQNSLSVLHAPKSSQEQLMSPSFSSEQLQIPMEAVSLSCLESETSESFFNNLPRRIEHGLQAKMDLQPLAERLVKSSIYWLNKLCETDKNLADHNPRVDDSCSRTVFAELKKLLLKESKEMKEMREHNDSSSKAPESTSMSDNIVRQYELQIFLRMEILRSDISESIEEAAKQKFLNQICSFMEITQYLVEGGIHGQIKLCDYVERTIKSRYSHILEDVVNEIYTRMDLLPFGDEEEAQILLLDSEDSNHSWKDRQERHGKPETYTLQQSVSADDEFHPTPENVDESTQETREDECARKLIEARERREKARRFVSFTRSMPELQRVRAPKQPPKAMKGKSELLQRELKRKNRRRGNESVVCETPLTGRKRSFSPKSSKGEEQKDRESSYSVSKALFQD